MIYSVVIERRHGIWPDSRGTSSTNGQFFLWQTVKLPEGMFGAAPCEVQQFSARLQTGAASSDAGLEKEVRGVCTMYHGVEDISKRSKQP